MESTVRSKHYREWIPETVRGLRGDRSLEDVAGAAGISVSYLSDIERGRTVPTIKTLDAIFTACGVTLTLGFKREVPTFDYVEVKVSVLRQLSALVNEITPRQDED